MREMRKPSKHDSNQTTCAGPDNVVKYFTSLWWVLWVHELDKPLQ